MIMRKWLSLLLPQSFFLLCLCLLLWQLGILLSQFRSGVTSTSISSVKHQRLPLPFVTVCPRVPFAVQTASYGSEEEYVGGAVKFEDIFQTVRTVDHLAFTHWSGMPF